MPARRGAPSRAAGSLGGSRDPLGLVDGGPVNRDNGASRGRRAIADGRTRVRDVLHMAALTAIRWNPAIQAAHDRPRDRGTPAKAAIVAATRKLLTILNALLRDQQPWQAA